MKNNNGPVIRRLTRRSLHANKKRNLFLIAAIFLTTLLLASVFSIGGSFVKSLETEKLRLAGSTAHTAIPYPTDEQIVKMHSLDYVKLVGNENTVGFSKLSQQMGGISLQMVYCDHNNWEYIRKPARDDFTGSYPQAEDEIIVSLVMLEKMGIRPETGAKIPLSYDTDAGNEGSLTTQEFKLTGWFTDYTFISAGGQVGVAFVSQALSEKHGKTFEKDGSANLVFTDNVHTSEYSKRLKGDIPLTERQQTIITTEFGTDQEDYTVAGLVSVLAIAAFFVLTGYLLIYNVLYISVSQNVRFYGLLKTSGTTPKQLRQIVRGQILLLSAIGIPLGILAAFLLSVVVVPAVLAGMQITTTGPVVSFSPLIYLGAAGFALITAFLGARKPAQKAAGIPPVEAQKYTGISYDGSRKYRLTHGKPYKMAFRNIFRDKKRAATVLCSLTLGLSTFVIVTTFVSAMGLEQYIDAQYSSDFLLTNNSIFKEKPQDALNTDLLAAIKLLPGFEWLSESTIGWGVSEEEGLAPSGNGTSTDQRRVSIMFIGVDDKAIDKGAAEFDRSIDIDAFKRGDFALVTTGSSELSESSQTLFAQSSGVTISPGLNEEERRPKVTVPLGGLAPDSVANTNNSSYPAFVVSDTLMRGVFGDLYTHEVRLDVLPGYEKQTLETLKTILKDTDIRLISKQEALKEAQNATFILYILGGTVALIIALIGILNFINVMSTGIMVRKNELAIMESIGMEKREIRQMLVFEGIGYAAIALLLTATLGNAAAYGIVHLFQLQADYAVFTYPVIPVAVMFLLVIAVCIGSPEMTYRSINKATIVERLREAE